MRVVFFLIGLMLIAQSAICQNRNNQSSQIEVKGNNNTIKVYQGNGNKIYDLNDDKNAREFLNYLSTLPGISNEIKSILKYDKKIYPLVRNIAQKVDQQALFNTNDFIKRFEDVIRENEKLKIENQELIAQTNDVDFAAALKEANEKLKLFDNEGYQKVLENFKRKIKEKHEELDKTLAKTSYLQALNNNANYNYGGALAQINEALSTDMDNVEYLILKGDILYELNNYQNSRDIFNKIFKVTKDGEGKALILNKIGLTYEGESSYDKALQCFQYEIEVNKSVYQTKPQPYNNIGVIYTRKGDYSKALEYYKVALAIEKRLLIIDTIELANTYNSIGVCYYQNDQVALANVNLYEALKLQTKKNGEYSPDVAVTYNNFSLLYIKEGKRDSAQIFLDKMRSVIKKLALDTSGLSAESYKTYGLWYMAQNCFDCALQKFSISLKLNEIIYGKENYYVAESFYHIGRCYYNMRFYEKALAYTDSALKIQTKVVNDGPVIADTYEMLGLSYMNLGSIDRALYILSNDCLKKCLWIREKVFAPSDPILAESNFFVAQSYKMMHLPDSAFKYYQKTLFMNKRNFGENSSAVEDVNMEIGLLRIETGKSVDGLSYLSKTGFDTLSNMLKAKFLSNVALSLNNDDSPQKLNILSLAIQFIDKNNQAELDFDALRLYQNIAMLYCQLGYKNDANKYYLKAKEISENIHVNTSFEDDYKNCGN
ncbi:MAG TPA: tetratricopeptide repeat protein [Mucilaginibacter sp.]|nr:tetratricopeptide repeat protein [Mucilaginibacter sp.]